MSDSWCYLQYRYGEEKKAPTREDIAAALEQLNEENLPGMAEAGYEEHGSASLRYGYDEGPMYVLDITRHGTARWEEWADQDFDMVLRPMMEMNSLSREKALLLCEQLAAGDIEAVRACFQSA